MILKPPQYKFCPFCSSLLETRIEESKERKWCSKCRWTYYPHVSSAVGAVIVKNDAVLMVKRNREPYKNTWGFPAGYVDFGEHPEESLLREVKEETGLTVIKSEFISIIQNPDDPNAPGHFGIFYKVLETKGGIINSDKNENQDISWHPIHALPIIGWESHKKIANILGFQTASSSFQ